MSKTKTDVHMAAENAGKRYEKPDLRKGPKLEKIAAASGSLIG